ncbi:hypothetical protein [Maribellus mangrovi]|uniref:hypothetical protein n=1 Tax=Maribellus mangrovi TaxID=3133146 RepID=UPI0030EC1F2B
MKKLFFIIVLLPYLFFSCETEVYDSGEFQYENETEFDVLRNYRSMDEKLQIRIDNIHDSRCPIGATCIWQGEAKVFMTLIAEAENHLVLSTFDNQRDTVLNYEIILTDVLPYPDLSVEIDPEDYKVVLQINRLAD